MNERTMHKAIRRYFVGVFPIDGEAAVGVSESDRNVTFVFNSLLLKLLLQPLAVLAEGLEIIVQRFTVDYEIAADTVRSGRELQIGRRFPRYSRKP